MEIRNVGGDSITGNCDAHANNSITLTTTVHFTPPLIPGRLLRRYKRFLADIRLANGVTVVAHCPDPGSMRTCSRPGSAVWLSEHDSARRKLRYTWELIETDTGLVSINTHRTNAVVAEALTEGRIRGLTEYDDVRREVAYGDGSRVDFLLQRGDERCFVEVKSVTMAASAPVASIPEAGVGARANVEGRMAFPDAVTKRGRKHLEALMAMKREGHRAVQFFCCNHTGATSMAPADDIDPGYGETLRRAARAGVELMAYSTVITPEEIYLGRPIPIEL